MDLLSRKFKALSEEVRLRILAMLDRNGELCVCEVEEALDLSQSAASRHLRTLARAGLVDSRREGQWVYYRITQPADDAQALLLSTVKTLLAGLDVPVLSPDLEASRASACGESAEAR